jgi:tetratricopeptide (TPR) repeat protein
MIHTAAYRYWTLGSLYAQFGFLPEALTHYQLAASTFRRDQDLIHAGHVSNRRGEIYLAMGQSDRAFHQFQIAIQLFHRGEQASQATAALRNLAMVLHQRGHSAAAMELLEQALSTCDRTGNSLGEAATLTCMGEIYSAQRQFLFALGCFDAALEIYRTAQANTQPQSRDALLYQSARVLSHLANLCEQTGHPDLAEERHQEAFELLQAIKNPGTFDLTMGY